MAENSGQTGPKTPTDSNFTHPYVKYEGTAIWTSLETAISDLVANGDLVEQTNRKYIVGVISVRFLQQPWKALVLCPTNSWTYEWMKGKKWGQAEI